MVVDDCSISRAVMEQGLERLGLWNIDSTADANTAFRKITAAPVGVVISDYRMPSASGLDLLAGLRNHPATRAIPFIMCSGAMTSTLVDKGNALGMDAYLMKPYSHRQLKTALVKAVGRLATYTH